MDICECIESATGSRHPLWDQQFEAQQVRVLTLTGAVAGVVARSNGHFGPQHAKETAVVTADDLCGLMLVRPRARTSRPRGIALLDPRPAPGAAVADCGGVAGP